MKCNFRLALCSILLCSTNIVFGADIEKDLSCLVKAYPESLFRGTTVDTLITSKGQILKYSDDLKDTSFDYVLEHADLKTQMQLIYPVDALVEMPAVNADPGRLRSDLFFKSVYGSTEQEVLGHTELVYWAPCKCNIRFSSLNGAARALKSIGDTLGMDDVLSRYVQKSAGSYTYRNIQGTARKSVHSYAAAVDFSLPYGLSKYWLWSGCNEGKTCMYPQDVLKDKNLKRVVKIFEDNGFIWGGKWYHFDTVHFEYRPELVGKRCI